MSSLRATTRGMEPTTKPKKPRAKTNARTGRTIKKTRARAVDVGLAIKTAQDQKTAVRLKMQGVPMAEIAEHLGVDLRSVSRILAKAMEEYFADRDEIVHRYNGFFLSRNDLIMRSWMPRALGGRTAAKDPVTGEDTVITVEPSAEAAHIVLSAMRDLSRHLGGSGAASRVELTGVAGGPIRTAAVDSSDAARLVREAFGGAAAKSLGGPVTNGSNVYPAISPTPSGTAPVEEPPVGEPGVDPVGAVEPGSEVS